MQNGAVEGVMLHILNHGQALGARIVLDREIDEHVFGHGVVDEVFDFHPVQLQVLRRGLATINDSRHATGGAKFFNSTTADGRARERVQWY